MTVLASSGDDGATDAQANGSDLYTMPVNSWPSADPLVTSIGGTMLNLDANGNRLAPDVVWNDLDSVGGGAGGGGVSSVFPRPAFQNGVRQVVGNHRGTPDISLSAAVDGAVILYFSFEPNNVGYHLVGGTARRRRSSRASSPWPTSWPVTRWATSTTACTCWRAWAARRASST